MYEESRMLYDGVYGAQKMEGLRMQDFVRIQERYRAFWNRENETPLLWLCAPRAHTDYSRAPRRPEKTEDLLLLAKRPAGRARVSRNGKGIRILSLTRTMCGGSGSVP